MADSTITLKELDYIVHHYVEIAAIFSPVFSCKERQEIIWRCFAEVFEGLGRSFLDSLRYTKKASPGRECLRVVMQKEKVDAEHVEDMGKMGDIEDV